MQGYDPNLLSRYIGLSKKPHQALSILVIPIHEKMASGPWTIMKRMARCVGLQHGHFTNHSARKYLVQKLSDNHVSPNEIIQISGHRNLQSINSYSQISETHHSEISTLITCTERSQSTAVSLTPQEQQSSALEARAEFLNSIFSAPFYGGTININLYNSDNGPVKN